MRSFQMVVEETPADRDDGWWLLRHLVSGDPKMAARVTLPTFMLNPAVRFRGSEVGLTPAAKPGAGFWRVES